MELDQGYVVQEQSRYGDNGWKDGRIRAALEATDAAAIVSEMAKAGAPHIEQARRLGVVE